MARSSNSFFIGLILGLGFTLSLSAQAVAGSSESATAFAGEQWWKVWKKSKSDTAEAEAAKDSTDFEKLIDKAVSDTGLFVVHRKKTDYYYEIPKQLLNRDMYVVNKVSKVPARINDAGLNRGMEAHSLVIQFELDTNLKKVFVREYKPFVDVDENDAIALSVHDNFQSNIVEAFDLECYNADSSAVLIKVNKIYDGSEKSFSNVFGVTGLGMSANTGLSRIRQIKSFPENIVVKSELTGKIPGAERAMTLTLEVTSNLVLLPEQPMQPRFADRRVGFFTKDRWYFSDKQQGLEKRQLITRWRMEPKEEDIDKYLAGELVEPKKPIVYYIDPATPPQWRPWIKKGIEEWQAAFEQAGFKNAIIAKDAPVDDPDFDVDDVRYSTIVYAASSIANAMGPSIIDPRSGEILEADVIWWHNVMTALKSWMRVQTGVIDPLSRSNTFGEDHLGDAIRFVSSHEVGHTLGLMHNMAGSYAFPVDSLRSPSFTERMGGTATSIMDYARFNYVAQPGDGVKHITPEIGIYDKFAIEFAYRYYNANSAEKESAMARKLVASHAGDPLYWYGEQQPLENTVDPRAQSEDVSNDAVKASTYGLENLKRITQNIEKWTAEEGASMTEAGKLLLAVINQWHQYSYHVLANVGGIYLNQMYFGDDNEKQAFEFVPESYQRKAVQYLVDNVFEAPKWLFDAEVIKKVYPTQDSPMGPYEYAPFEVFKHYQSFIVWELMNQERLSRMLENEVRNGKKAYTALELMDDLHNAVFADTKRGRSLDLYERALQKTFVDALIIASDRGSVRKVKSLHLEDTDPIMHMPMLCQHGAAHQASACEDVALIRRLIDFSKVKRSSEVMSIKRGELKRTLNLLKSKQHSGNRATQYHYQDLIMRIQDALDN